MARIAQPSWSQQGNRVGCFMFYPSLPGEAMLQESVDFSVLTLIHKKLEGDMYNDFFELLALVGSLKRKW